MGTINVYRYEAMQELDTENLAKAVALHCSAGMVLALDGELGAGKTRFAQALAQALGVQDVVNSPTFTLIKQYEGTRLPFYHMDVYRMTSDEAAELGLDEYFYGDGVTLVEWASRIDDLLPADRLEMHIAHGDDGARLFTLCPHGADYVRMCEQLREDGVLR